MHPFANRKKLILFKNLAKTLGYRTLKSSADALVEYVVMRIKAL